MIHGSDAVNIRPLVQQVSLLCVVLISSLVTRHANTVTLFKRLARSPFVTY